MATIISTRGIVIQDLEEERLSTPLEASFERHIGSWVRRD
jgi:hypothetical protein